MQLACEEAEGKARSPCAGARWVLGLSASGAPVLSLTDRSNSTFVDFWKSVLNPAVSWE